LYELRGYYRVPEMTPQDEERRIDEFLGAEGATADPPAAAANNDIFND
jgi:hypothetical protein